MSTFRRVANLQTVTGLSGNTASNNMDIPGTLDVTGAATFDSTIADSAGTSYSVQKIQKRVQHSDLTAAATSEAIDFDAAIPAGSWILGAYVDIDTLFSGGSVSDLTVELGISSGDANYLLEAVPAFTGDPTGEVLGTAGVAFASDDSNIGKAYRNAATTLALNVVATGDNVVNLTAGDVTAVVLYVVAAQS